MFFTFPEDAHWNPDRMTVEFGVEIGEYRARRSTRLPEPTRRESDARTVP